MNAVLRDAAAFGSERSPYNVLVSAKDGDDHVRLRQALQGALSARVIASIEPTIEGRARELAEHLPRGRADLVTDYVAPLGRAVIGTLLSIDPADETAIFDALQAGDETSVERFLRAHASRRTRAAPDVVARLEAAGLDHEHELLPHLRMLLQAGHGTMVDLVADVLLDLVSTRWSTADASAADEAMERVFRSHAPLPFVERRARQHCTVGSVMIEPGDTIVLALASANRDDAAIGRPHLGLGAGAHSCLGGPLLRCATRHAVVELRRVAPKIRLLDEGVERDRSALADRGLARMRVELGPRH